MKERASRSPWALPGFMLGLSTRSTTMGCSLWNRATGSQIVGMDLHRHRSVLVQMTEMAGSWGRRGSATARPGWLPRSPGLVGSRG